MQRIYWIAILCALALGLSTAAISAGDGSGVDNRLSNGSFEEGFAPNGVGLGWTAFNNGGSADYIYRDDTAARFAADGTHSQFLRISTLDYFDTEPDRYSGIYQTVAVVPGNPYTLTLSGMLRVLANDVDKNNWSYVVQWGVDPLGGAEWRKVAWNDVPWSTTYGEDETGALSKFTTTVNAASDKLTIFIRAVKKWPTRYRVLFVNLDAISLTGASPAVTSSPALDVIAPKLVYTTKPFAVHVSTSDQLGVSDIRLYDGATLVSRASHATGPLTKETDFTWTPTVSGTHVLRVEARNEVGKTVTTTRAVEVVPIAEFLRNGDFERGFAASGVALDWAGFHNGGRKVWYTFANDPWPPVVKSGKQSQFMAISMMGYGETDPDLESDRYAGICQVVTGLTQGATYYLTANGTLRITEGDKHTDDWSWTAQYGYVPGISADCAAWPSVTNWDALPWGHVDYNTLTPKMNTFTTVITAPSDTITLFFRAWYKWAIGSREFAVNLDNLSLAGYKPTYE